MGNSQTVTTDQERVRATSCLDGGGMAPIDPQVSNALDELRALRKEHQNLQRALAVHDELAQLALNGAAFSQLAIVFARIIGNPVLIESRFFKTLAYALPTGAPPRDEKHPSLRALRKDAAAQALWPRLQSERQPLLLPAARERRAQQVVAPARVVAPVVVADDVVGYVSIVERDRPVGSSDLSLARHAALAIGVEFVRSQAAIEADLRFKGDVLDVLIQSTDASLETRVARSALLAYDCNAPQTLILLATNRRRGDSSRPDSPPPLHDLATLAASWARRLTGSSLVAEKEGQIVVLLAGELTKLRPRVRASSGPVSTPPRSLHGLQAGLSTTQVELTESLRREVVSFFPVVTLSIAIAPVVRDSRDLHQTYAIARRALAVLNLLDENGQSISTSDPRLAVFLLFDSTKPDTRREFVDLVLGPLIAYDQRGRRALVETLETYLDCGGNLETTARTLNVHTSTLKYRLQRIAQISGLDARNVDHRFNAALALRLRPLTDL